MSRLDEIKARVAAVDEARDAISPDERTHVRLQLALAEVDRTGYLDLAWAVERIEEMAGALKRAEPYLYHAPFDNALTVHELIQQALANLGDTNAAK